LLYKTRLYLSASIALECKRLILKCLQPRKSLAYFFDMVEIRKDPYGVVLVMGAWNYPVQLNILPMMGAIAAGNCVIVKPSEVAMATAKYLYENIPKYLDTVRDLLFICCLYNYLKIRESRYYKEILRKVFDYKRL